MGLNGVENDAKVSDYRRRSNSVSKCFFCQTEVGWVDILLVVSDKVIISISIKS